MSARDGDAPLYYFYELHESDTDLFADVLLAHQTEYDEAEFLELVLEARKSVLEKFETDSLIEAVAAELAEQAGFLIIDDSQLRVAVNVSSEEDGTFVADVDVSARIGGGRTDDFRTLLVDVEPDDAVWGVPDGTRRKTYLPLASDTDDQVPATSVGPVKVTVAPGVGVPSGRTTLPDTVPVWTAWAEAIPAPSTRTRPTAKSPGHRMVFRIIPSSLSCRFPKLKRTPDALRGMHR